MHFLQIIFVQFSLRALPRLLSLPTAREHNLDQVLCCLHLHPSVQLKLLFTTQLTYVEVKEVYL